MFRWRKKASTTSEPTVIQHYRLLRKLGEGGMGVVFEARDERLDRLVAIKRLRPSATDPAFRQRLLREARVAAGISHPNICQVYELGEHNEQLYIVMELLPGESLAERIGRGVLPLGEALQTTLGILAAFEALHSRGIIHRDLKPTNVFLTPHGVKLLDFGLARPHLGTEVEPALTTPGLLIGTPRYMAPEMLGGEPLGPATDVFALGAVLFEMLTGKYAFGGNTILEICAAVAQAQPPALVGGPDVMAADRLIQRALAKDMAQRYPDAQAMAAEVREALRLLDTGPTPRVRTMRRVIVLPFRVPRPDPEIDFLAFSLPEAITASLSQLESVAVRSTAAAERYAGERPDLKVIAAETGVDAVLTGTLLRAGDQVRVSTQLVEAPDGALVCSRTAQVPLTDIFSLQDDLTHQIVDALAIPLSARDDQALKHDVPANPDAYELYLRANHIGGGASAPTRLATARDLYVRCLELDPGYAPAWARLGRVYRVRAKFGHADGAENLALAEAAFRKALEISPDLSLAHNLYTHFEIEELGHPREAMLRLLRQVDRHASDPDLLCGLVVACRFCGLLQASLAADRRARRIDPGVRTSVAYTHWMVGDYEQAVLTDLEEVQTLRSAAMWLLGRKAEALELVQDLHTHWPATAERAYLQSQRGALEGDREASIEGARALLASTFHDPEGLLSLVRNLAHVGATQLALETLDPVVGPGFHCPAALVRDPWLDPLRTDPIFLRVLRRAEEEYAESVRAYVAAGGERILGVVG